MDFTDLPIFLIAVAILTATGAAFFYWIAKRRQAYSIKIARATRPSRDQLTYAAKKLAAEWPPQTISIPAQPQPPIQPLEFETVSVAMAPSSPTAPSAEPDNHCQPDTLPAFTIDAVLWERLISSHPHQDRLCPAVSLPPDSASTVQPTLAMIHDDQPALDMIHDDQPALDMIHEEAAPGRLHGMLQAPQLEHVLESQEPFTGLIVSIGINDVDGSVWHRQGSMQSVGSYLAGLLYENDFCGRTAYDEFILVYPGERRARSQRRLNDIAERLWDYQLSGLGLRSVLLSWGGVQVQDQPLADAIASATERMRETRRISISAASSQALREVVSPGL